MVEIGIDIGGTFTDVVCLIDRRDMHAVKVQNSADLLGSVIDGVSRVMRLASERAPAGGRVSYMHGTTVATNAVLEGRGAITACLTTKGFEDILEIGRQKRSRMYDLGVESETPSFISPRRLRAGITERIDGAGSILVPLAEEEVLATVRRLRERFAIQSVAVCYLNAYRNGAHEARTAELIRQHFPDLAVSLSSEINPVFREYERTCVTVFDAYVRPAVQSYVARLAQALHDAGGAGELKIMQSRGGIGSVKMAVARPVSLLLSGPAAGVVGAKLAGSRSGAADLITMDIGGTTCDVSLIREGRIELTKEGRLRGFPLRLPTTDINSIGAGGGSIAWLDEAGGLHVGPRSAGAIPGPACYGLGSQEPTTTDASVVLGYLNPDYFAGGSLRLDARLAHEAVGTLARKLHLDVDATAMGIHRIMNAQMAEAVRLITVKRGYDPRRFALVAFGGAGPVHACSVARLLGIKTVLVPHSPGTLAAFGLLVSDVEYDGVAACLMQQHDIAPAALEQTFLRLEDRGRRQLLSEGLAPEEIHVRRSADLRYTGQSFELEVSMAAPVTPSAVADAIRAFNRRHEEVFGHADSSRVVEFVNLRTVHFRPAAPVELTPRHSSRASARVTRRSAFFEGIGRVDVPIYRRDEFPEEQSVSGPCIVEQPDTTTVVHPGQSICLDAGGNLVVHT